MKSKFKNSNFNMNFNTGSINGVVADMLSGVVTSAVKELGIKVNDFLNKLVAHEICNMTEKLENIKLSDEGHKTGYLEFNSHTIGINSTDTAHIDFIN